VHIGNFYHLPIQSNGKPGNLLIDTGSPATLIFRSSLKKLDLTESKTKAPVRGLFGAGREVYGLTTIRALTTGNCRLTNVPVQVATGRVDNPFGLVNSNGLLGLRELIKFGAVLDLPNRLVYLRPSRPSGDVGAEIKSTLLRQGYAPVPLSITDFHLRIAGAVNKIPCYFLVDTGAYLTLLDSNFASGAKIQVIPTRLVARGLVGSRSVGMAILPSLRIGNYELRHASTSIVRLDAQAVGGGSRSEVAGLIGIEYLAMNSAIFDFITGTMYLRPHSH
jgi:predicted aspartyl protease